MKDFEEMSLTELLLVDPSDIPIEKIEEFSKWFDIRMKEYKESFLQY